MVKKHIVTAVAKTNKDGSIRKKMGRPCYEPNEFDRGKLHCALTYGMAEVETESYVGRDIDTLKKHYPEMFANVRADRKEAVKKSLFYQATMLNIPTSTIFWLKSQHEEFQGMGTDDNDKDVASKILQAIAKALPD
jgi:hypothetical protein